MEKRHSDSLRVCIGQRCRKRPAAARTVQQGLGEAWVWDCRCRLRKTFSFASPRPMLVFSVRAQELAESHRAKVETRSGFGRVTVILMFAGTAERDAKGSLLADELDRAARAVQQDRTA